MLGISMFDFLRKARRFWFSSEESLDLEASPTSPGSSTKAGEHAQNGSATPGLSCIGMIKCKSVDKKKLARASSSSKHVKRQSSARRPAFRMPGVMAALRRSAGAKAAIGATRMDVVAARRCPETNEASLWKRRTQEEPPLLQFN